MALVLTQGVTLAGDTLNSCIHVTASVVIHAVSCVSMKEGRSPSRAPAMAASVAYHCGPRTFPTFPFIIVNIFRIVHIFRDSAVIEA